MSQVLDQPATSTTTPDLDFGFSKPRAETRIVVAMSGGVDSSVAAALVAAAGYETIGITLQLYDHGAAVERKGACCAGQDIHDARNVSDALGIPHYVLDYESKFRQSVMDDFADAYLRARHQSPACAATRPSNSATCWRPPATWARMRWSPAITCSASKALPAQSYTAAVDPSRDQSYFLFATTPEQLDFLRFPLGGYPRQRPARWLSILACRSRLSPTARISASSRTAPMPRWLRSCAPAPSSPAISSTATVLCWANTKALSTSPSVNAAA